MPRARTPTPLRPTRVLEKNVEHAVDRLFAAVGFRAIRFSQAHASQQTEGIPDRRYIHAPARLAIWFEVKKPDGRWRLAQQRFAQDCVALGELYVVGGLDEAYAILTALRAWNGRELRAFGSTDRFLPEVRDPLWPEIVQACAKTHLTWTR